jgi:hypothetical protein
MPLPRTRPPRPHRRHATSPRAAAESRLLPVRTHVSVDVRATGDDVPPYRQAGPRTSLYSLNGELADTGLDAGTLRGVASV